MPNVAWDAVLIEILNMKKLRGTMFTYHRKLEWSEEQDEKTQARKREDLRLPFVNSQI